MVSLPTTLPFSGAFSFPQSIAGRDNRTVNSTFVWFLSVNCPSTRHSANLYESADKIDDLEKLEQFSILESR